MGNNVIGINEAEINKLITEINDCSNKVKNIFQQINDLISNTKNFYDCKSATALRNKYYKLDDDWKINIRNNTLNYGNNLVYVDVYNDIESKTYTFSVYKEMTEEVNGIDNYKKSLEINNVSHLELYKVQLLGVGLFLTIVLLFTVLFKRRRI